MASVLTNPDTLQEQLLLVREGLKDLDDNIKKITGRPLRSAGQNGPGGINRRGAAGSQVRGRGRLFAMARRGIEVGRRDGPPAKRRAVGEVFGRGSSRMESRGRPQPDSGDDEDFPRKFGGIQSSVVPPPGTVRSRKEKLEEQSKDTKGRARNRRMFGLLLGTLQKFKEDSQQTECKEKEQQRKEIEEKLEERAVKEQEDLKKAKINLFSERREKIAQLKKLERKMEIVNGHAAWERETKNLCHFIRTKTKPHIFYLPKEMIPSTIRKQQDTSKLIEEMMRERREKLERDLEEMEKQEEAEEANEEEHDTMDTGVDEGCREGRERRDGEGILGQEDDIGDENEGIEMVDNDDDEKENLVKPKEESSRDEGRDDEVKDSVLGMIDTETSVENTMPEVDAQQPTELKTEYSDSPQTILTTVQSQEQNGENLV